MIGEAVTQTFQNLSQQITGTANAPTEPEERTETTETTTTVTTTTEENADGEQTQSRSETRQERTTTVNGQTTHRQVVRGSNRTSMLHEPCIISFH